MVLGFVVSKHKPTLVQTWLPIFPSKGPPTQIEVNPLKVHWWNFAFKHLLGATNGTVEEYQEIASKRVELFMKTPQMAKGFRKQGC